MRPKQGGHEVQPAQLRRLPPGSTLPRDIYRIPIPTPFPVGPINAYLVYGERIALVDPGPHTEQAKAVLMAQFKRLGLLPKDLDLIVLTHQHHDHVGLAGWLQAVGEAPIAAPRTIAKYLADFDASMETDEAYMVALCMRHGVRSGDIDLLVHNSRRERRFGHSSEVDEVLKPGESLLVGSRSLVVLERPGHSPTDTVYHDSETKLLIAGDHLLQRVSSNPFAHAPSGYPGAAPSENSSPDLNREPTALVTYLDSLAETIAMDVSQVLPGHGLAFREHREVARRHISMLRNRAHRISQMLPAPKSAAELLWEIWPSLKREEIFLALSEVLGHLNWLEAAGTVRAHRDSEPVMFELTR